MSKPNRSVFIVLDDSKDCYDAGGIYFGVYNTKEEAEDSISGFDAVDRSSFVIVEETL